MATVVEGLGDLGYGVAYRVVDGRHFGSPQRRARVIIVGHLGGDPRPAWQVLGDDYPGGEAAGPRAERRYKRGPKALVGATDRSGTTLFRKSANPRKALGLGGWETWVPDHLYNTLAGYDGGLATRQKHLVVQHERIRTLTPREWERLQMFPDDWTAMVPESARYAQLGNAMHVGMSTWLGRRIRAVNDELYQLPEQPAARKGRLVTA